MAMAPEELKPVFDRNLVSKLTNEGRMPIVVFPNIEIDHNEPFLRSNRMSPHAFVPGSETEPARHYRITPIEAKQIAQIQQELLKQ